LNGIGKFVGFDSHKYNLSIVNEDKLYYAGGGPGYVISRALADSIFQDEKTPFNITAASLCGRYSHEDVTIGEFCHLHECEVRRVNGMEAPGYPMDMSVPLATMHADSSHNTDVFLGYAMMSKTYDEYDEMIREKEAEKLAQTPTPTPTPKPTPRSTPIPTPTPQRPKPTPTRR